MIFITLDFIFITSVIIGHLIKTLSFRIPTRTFVPVLTVTQNAYLQIFTNETNVK